jgi:hypothetical protein
VTTDHATTEERYDFDSRRWVPYRQVRTAGQRYRYDAESSALAALARHPAGCVRYAGREPRDIKGEPREGVDFDRDDVTLLKTEGDSSRGYGQTLADFLADRVGEEAAFQSEHREWYPKDADPSAPGGELLWLPDPWVVKFPTREYWCDAIASKTREIWAVYVVDREHRVHICSLTASAEQWFIEHQADLADAVVEDERERERIDEEITAANGDEDQVSYIDFCQFERIIENPCRPGFFPENGHAGGYRWETGCLTMEAVVEEVMESRCNGDI